MTAELLPPITDAPPKSDLASRAVVGVILIAVALTCVWLGGWAFSLMILAGVALVWWEWCAMHGIGGIRRAIGAIGLLPPVMLLTVGEPVATTGLVIAGVTTALAILGRFHEPPIRWAPTGYLYAALPAAALVWLRAQPDGLTLVLWVLVVVWATDIFAYFAGRSIGGPKIAPKLSPKKTWAGLGGGVLGAATLGVLIADWAEWPMLPIALLSGVLAVFAQAGDFYESWLKRKVGVKDSGTLLPGHGGVMDRVDGLVPVAVLVGGALMVRAWYA